MWLLCTSKVLAVCTAIRHLYHACACDTWRVNSPSKANTLHLPYPGMHYSGADTGGQQTPLTTGLQPYSKPSNSTYMSLYNYSQSRKRDHCIGAYTPCIQLTYSKAAQSRQQVQRRSISHEELHATDTARAAQVHAPTAQ